MGRSFPLLLLFACNPRPGPASPPPERCNGLDDDSDGAIDEGASDAPTWYADADGDGFGDPAAASSSCEAPDGHVADATDCDDAAPLAYPGAEDLTGGVCGDGVGDCDAPCRYDGALPLDELAVGLYHGSPDDGLGGNDLAPVGDVTGDGVPDAWFGRKLLAPARWSQGVHPDTEAVVARLRGKEDGDQIYRVASVGDATGDGRGDIVVLVLGTRRSEAVLLDAAPTGEVDVYEVGRQLLPGEDLWLLAGAGDVDADGLSDVLLTDAYDGRVWLTYGADLDRAVTIEPEPAGPRGVHGLGDLDGDGRDDFAVHAGSATSEYESLHVFLEPPRADVSTADADVELYQPGPDVAIGISVDPAGDADGDGHADLLVGYVTRENRGDGRAPQLTAAALLLGPIDADRDLDMADARFMVEVGYEANFGDVGAVVRGVGDMDADGLDDYAIGCEMESAMYLYYGPRTGVQPLADADARLWSPYSSDVGNAFDTVGDVDGDGHSDLFIRDGSYNGQDESWGAPEWGGLYVLFGQAP